MFEHLDELVAELERIEASWTELYAKGDQAVISKAGTRQKELEAVEAELKELLLPRDPNDGRNVIVEIQGAEGGEEANLWAGDLFRMYQRFAESQGLKTEVMSSQPSDHGGYRDVTFL